MRWQVSELTAERNYAVASKQQAAEAAAALEKEAAALLEQKKLAVTALQSQISQLQARHHHNPPSATDVPRSSIFLCTSVPSAHIRRLGVRLLHRKIPVCKTTEGPGVPDLDPLAS